VKEDRGDDHPRLAAQNTSEPASGVVVQGLVAAVLDDDLGQHDGQREFWVLTAERVDVK
jgi:hypothetical protein